MATASWATPRDVQARTRWLPAVAIGLLVSIAISSPALADTRTEARRHFRRGMELVVQGQIDAGIAELEEAYNILPHPNVLYNIGRAYAEAGRYEDARDAFERYLETDPPDREEVRAVVAAIDQRIEARQLIARAAADAAAAQSGTSATTTETTETTPSTAPMVSAGQLATLDGAVEQARGLCAATASPDLCARADALVALRADLAAGGTRTTVSTPGATETTSGSETATSGTETTTADTSEPPATDATLQVGASTSGEAAYVEQVDAAARMRSSPLDAPASTTIISRQDIRLSGITTVGELLRRAAGVSVMQTTPGSPNIGIRGFNRLLSPRVLMLVNGRTTYIDPLGTPFWETGTFQVEDIERIEVIRGPASVLYGANGFSGIVNIVLRTPGDEAGTEVTGGIGNAGQARAHVSTSGRLGALSYRLNGGYEQMDRFTQPMTPGRADIQPRTPDPTLAQRSTMFGAQLRYRASDKVSFVAEGGFRYLSPFNFYATTAFLDFYVHGVTSYVSAAMQTPYGRIRTFYNRFNADTFVNDNAAGPSNFENNTFDVEAEFNRRFHVVVDQDVHLGLNYRLKNVDWSYIPGARTEHHLGVFLEDTLRLGERVRLVGAIRMDHHPLLPRPQFSPRGAVIVRPTEGQSIRLTAGTAFRMPSMMESYLTIEIPTPVTAVGALALGSDEARRLLGRPALRPERIFSVELGYQNQESDYVSFDVSAYYNRVDGIFAFQDTTSALTLADYANAGTPGATGAAQLAGYDRATDRFIYGETGMRNEPERYHVIGGEAGVRFFPIDGLDVYANYALNATRVDNSRTGQVWDHRTSTHLINAGIQYRAPFGLDISSDFHYATATQWPEIGVSATGLERQYPRNPAFYLLNARVGMRVWQNRLELAVAGFNITNLHRTQHPSGQPLDARVMGSVTARF